MSATKIAASFRVSVTALVAKQPDSPVAVAWAWLHFHAALGTRGQPDVQSGVRAADPKTALIERSASRLDVRDPRSMMRERLHLLELRREVFDLARVGLSLRATRVMAA
jgi:hypothetical protein